MPKMTKAQTAKLEKLRAVLHASRDVIYSASADRDVPFSTCYTMAPQTDRDHYDAALDAVCAFERSMVGEYRAYRGTFGMFTPY